MRRFVSILLSLCFLLSGQTSSGQVIERVEPPCWWVGMNHSELQLLVYGENIGSYRAQLSYPGVQLLRSHQVENPNYLFLDLAIGPEAQPGEVELVFEKAGKKSLSYRYELKARTRGPLSPAGFDASDVIYLIFPDRFANGDPANDSVAEMLDKADRSIPDYRHGGDLQGIIDRVDYVVDLGATAVWINPFLEMNVPKYSYHGYAITDFYRVDPRHGSNSLFRELVSTYHEQGLKVIMDVVLNHCGRDHWFIKDLPSPDWINAWPSYTPCNFRLPTQTDPYASPEDLKGFTAGWFDRVMPDFNQGNPLLLTYLIQNCIWWIEYAGLDGLRLDTQPYSYKEGVAEWARRIRAEYPRINLVGEVWLTKSSHTSYWQAEARNADGYTSHLPSITDFPLHFAMTQAFNEADGWLTGLSRLYHTLSEDFIYAHPEKLLIFPDNHDLTRYFTSVEEDLEKWKMGMAFLLTTRGIPMIYYGTEILMTGRESDGHGGIREDFPGGWPGDERDAFTAAGRRPQEQEAFSYLRKLLNWRKGKAVLHHGKLQHYMPQAGIYVYFRYDDQETIMVVLNNKPERQKLDLDRFSARLKGFRAARDVVSGEVLEGLKEWELKGKSALVLELIK
jgi:glycosidase